MSCRLWYAPRKFTQTCTKIAYTDYICNSLYLTHYQRTTTIVHAADTVLGFILEALDCDALDCDALDCDALDCDARFELDCKGVGVPTRFRVRASRRAVYSKKVAMSVASS